MNLKKCLKCLKYSLNDECSCGEATSDAHYKFVKVRDAPKGNDISKIRGGR